MGRIIQNDGQEILHSDINKIGPLLELEMYDRVWYELLGRSVDAFFASSFRVSRTDSDTISIAAGLGIQHDGTQVSPEPTKRPVYLSAAASLDITTPHASLNRIDIVSVKAARAVTLTESRRYKATLDDAPASQSFDVEDDWEADCVITPGTPNASPAVPATPAGYIKVAEILVTAVTGIAASGALTDKRTTLKMPGGYDAVVGASAFCTDASLAAAIARVSAGAKILLAESETLSATVSIGKNNIEIHSLPGVTLTHSSGGTGITIAATGVRVRGLRFSGFTTTAIAISDTFNYNFVTECRFASCTAIITDNNTSPNNVQLANIEE